MSRRPTRRRDRERRFAPLGVLAILVFGGIAYFSYNALNGLPLQSHNRIAIDVPDANRIVATDDVRIGGIRVGQVHGVQARQAPGGRPYARVTLDIEPSVGRIPVDSTVRIRPASVLGATYVALTLGHSRQTVAPGAVLSLAHARPTVELTDLYDVFNRGSATNFQSVMRSLGAGLAGRGQSLNLMFGALSDVMPPLTRVTAALAAPQTRLGSFLGGYEHLAAALEPVGSQLASLETGGARTFAAMAGERRALAAMIEASPSAESATTAMFASVQPAFDGLARLMTRMRPAARLLPATLNDVHATLTAGLPAMRGMPAFNTQAARALAALGAATRPAYVGGALRKLGELMSADDETLSVLAPAQTHCNVIPLFFQNYSSYFGMAGTGEGPSLLSLGIATTGAKNEGLQSKEPAPNLGVNYLPNENSQECESGNEPDHPGQQLGNPPGMQPGHARDTSPPPGVLDRARAAGLMTAPPK